MISSRTGAALALVVSVAAVALATVAFMSTVRDDGEKPGRLVLTHLTNGYTGDPVLFPLDDFFAGRDGAGHLRAFYLYPPGYFGHERGCKIVWDARATVDTPGAKAGPGLFIEPCGGAHFNRDGTLVSGPADRALDEFKTAPGLDGVIVDTRKLFCGKEIAADATPPALATATPSAPGEQKTCDRVSSGTKSR